MANDKTIVWHLDTYLAAERTRKNLSNVRFSMGIEDFSYIEKKMAFDEEFQLVAEEFVQLSGENPFSVTVTVDEISITRVIDSAFLFTCPCTITVTNDQLASPATNRIRALYA